MALMLSASDRAPVLAHEPHVGAHGNRDAVQGLFRLWFGDGRRLPVPVSEAPAIHRPRVADNEVGERLLRWWFGDGRRLPRPRE
jgi:hypothetical protein